MRPVIIRPVPRGKVGVLIANLGTPGRHGLLVDAAVSERVPVDRRVIDGRPWIWQPMLKLIVLTKRPFLLGRGLSRIWNRERTKARC